VAKINISAEATAALTTSYAALTLTDDTTSEALAQNIPDACYLDWMHIQLDTIAGGAAAVTWYLCSDASMDVPLTKEVTTTIVAGDTTATDGAVVEALNVAYRRFSVGTGGSIYIAAKLDAGTANGIARIVWHI